MTSLKDSMEIWWVCPNCEHETQDQYEITQFGEEVFCGECVDQFVFIIDELCGPVVLREAKENSL